MIAPTIHLNGTSRVALLEQVTTALHALRATIGALELAEPHGRDYYPQGENAYRTALAEHASRLARLSSVRDELAQLRESIAG